MASNDFSLFVAVFPQLQHKTFQSLAEKNIINLSNQTQLCLLVWLAFSAVNESPQHTNTYRKMKDNKYQKKMSK